MVGAIKSGTSERTLTRNSATSSGARVRISFYFRHKKTPTNLVGVIKSGTSGRALTRNSATPSGARVRIALFYRHKKTLAKKQGLSKVVPAGGLEPPLLSEGDFESPMSTNFITLASFFFNLLNTRR